MASAFAHAYTASTLAITYFKNLPPGRLFVIGILCAIMPDIDVLAFLVGIPYSDPFGHRGFTHSLFFAAIAAIIISYYFLPKEQRSGKDLYLISLFLFLVIASHGLLDAMTNGGLGIAFFWPFHNERYFLPWQPIMVSPIGIKNFFTEWGLKVIISESLWIGLPMTTILICRLIADFLQRKKQKKKIP